MTDDSTRCPNGHENQPGDSHCGYCGTELPTAENLPPQEPAPTATSDASYYKRLAILGTLLAAVSIGIIVVSTRGGSSDAGEGNSASTGAAENEVTRFGCEISPDPTMEGVTFVDPTCTEGGVLTEYCDDVPADLLKVPAYDERQGPDTFTRIYAVGDASQDRGDALVTHYIPSTADPTNDGTKITCPDGATRYFTADQWQRFLRPS